jgi:hypothetical protein
LSICETEYPRHWEAFVIRNTDDVALDPREHHRVKVTGPMLDIPLSPEDVGQLIHGQIGPFLERNPEVWDLWRADAGVWETLSERTSLAAGLEPRP